MKIKHFAGYGTVNAVLTSKKNITSELLELKIRVAGNHERGIAVNDNYNAFNWLIKKHFGKTFNFPDLISVNITANDYQKGKEGIDEEFCEYVFVLRTK